MNKDILFDDSVLQGKTVITAKDIYNMLPPEINKNVEEICIMINNGRPVWLIFMEEDFLGYIYVPFSGKLEFDVHAKLTNFGRIYLYRKGRYLRKEYTTDHKINIYSVFYCFRRSMRLLKEQKEHWLYDENGGWGTCSETRWFFPYK